MAIRQSQTQANQQLQDQFRDFFNTNRYEHRGRDDHSYFGLVDVYHMNDNDAQLVREAKSRQLSNIVSHRLTSSQTHYKQHRQPLGPYNCVIHRELPDRVSVKTINVGPTQANQIKDYLASYNGHNLLSQYRSPEFTRVYAADETNEGLKVFFEYGQTLNEDIKARQLQNNPYSEELLWKLLTDLTKAAQRLNAGQQTLRDVRPTRVLFNDYQASVLPFDLGTGRDTPLSQKWNNGERIFYSREMLNLFQDEQQQNRQSVRQSQLIQDNENNQVFQIGLTVLAAGLLLSEEQVGVNDNRGFDQSRLNQLIQDFAAIYNRRDRLLSYFLQEVLLSGRRSRVSQIYNILTQNDESVQFLEQDFKNAVRNFLDTNTNYSREESSLPLTSHNSQVSHLWSRYPYHFYIELNNQKNDEIKLRVERNNQDVDRMIAEQQRKNELLLSQPGIRRPATNSQVITQTTSVLRSSQLGTVQASNYPTQFARESQNVGNSVYRQSQL